MRKLFSPSILETNIDLQTKTNILNSKEEVCEVRQSNFQLVIS